MDFFPASAAAKKSLGLWRASCSIRVIPYSLKMVEWTYKTYDEVLITIILSFGGIIFGMEPFRPFSSAFIAANNTLSGPILLLLQLSKPAGAIGKLYTTFFLLLLTSSWVCLQQSLGALVRLFCSPSNSAYALYVRNSGILDCSQYRLFGIGKLF